MNLLLPLDDGLARRLHRAFADRGHELYLVGGAVRDALLGHHDLDLDFATSARPEQTVAVLDTLSLGSPYRVGEKFGTIGVRAGGRLIEITTFRAETYGSGSRKPDVRFGATLREDLARRDFTINAMAIDLGSGRLIDPFDGARDVRARVLRAVGTPADRLREDPLRLLRAVRFAARFDLTVDEPTWEAMVARRDSLITISRERIRDEYEKVLVGPAPVHGMELLRDSGLLATSIPVVCELTRMRDHGPRHPLSLWDHTMRVLAGVPAEAVTRWAALLHDVAKPATRTLEPGGRPRFFHHDEVGAHMARDVLSGLRYSNAFVLRVVTLVETHMQLHAYSPDWSDGAVRRLVARLGPLLEPALALARADAAGHALDGRSQNGPRLDALESRVARIRLEPPESMHSPLTGHDLMRRYGRPPGPWIGAIKALLENEIIEGRLAAGDLDRAWELADHAARGST